MLEELVGGENIAMDCNIHLYTASVDDFVLGHFKVKII